MRKVIISLLCLVPAMAYGVDVCIKSTAYLSIFRPNVDGTAKDSDATDKIWKVVFDYRTITGEASCNEMCANASVDCTETHHVQTNLYTGKDDIGTDCWCRMWPVKSYNELETNHAKPATGPSSYWLHLKSYGTESACSTSCADDCAVAVRDNTDGFRVDMFEAIW